MSTNGKEKTTAQKLEDLREQLWRIDQNLVELYAMTPYEHEGENHEDLIGDTEHDRALIMARIIMLEKILDSE